MIYLTLKEYVNESVNKDELIIDEHLLLTKFNKNVDRVDSLFSANQTYHDLVMSLGDMGDDGVWLIVILTNLLACDSHLLKCKDYIIKIIINVFFEEEYPVILYSRYLKIFLFDENIKWLERFYYLKSIGFFAGEIEKMLSTLLNIINIYQDDKIIKGKLNIYYERLYSYYDFDDGKVFNDVSSLDDIYKVVFGKMNEIQNFVSQYGQNIFQTIDFENIQRIKLLATMDQERIDEFLNYFRAISSLDVSIICKILNINAKIVECTKEIDEPQTELKVIPFRKRGSKNENR